MKRTNTWQDAYITGTANLDLGDGMTSRIPLGDVGAAIEGAAATVKDYADGELDKDRTWLNGLETITIPKALADAKVYADTELAKDRTRLTSLEVVAIPKALTDAKGYTDVEVSKDRMRLTQAEAADVRQGEDIRKTLRDALAYADSKAKEIKTLLDTSHIALDVDDTPYYRLGSTTVKILQDTDGTPFYEAA